MLAWWLALRAASSAQPLPSWHFCPPAACRPAFGTPSDQTANVLRSELAALAVEVRPGWRLRRGLELDTATSIWQCYSTSSNQNYTKNYLKRTLTPIH